MSRPVRLLMTGATSFSGAWMARACAEAGIEVHAAIRSDRAAYDGVRSHRLAMLGGSVTLHPGAVHRAGALAALIAEVGADVVGYHGYPMEGFRSPDYDALGAAAALTADLDAELAAAADAGSAIVYTGTVYEPGPVAGAEARAAVSAYGLSKRVAYERLRLAGSRAGVPVHRFVIPNPFGPLEEGRFGNHLATAWGRGETPVVRTPRLVRDNIPVRELAVRYAAFVLAGDGRAASLEPSGYIESQFGFAGRLAEAVGVRLGRVLPLEALWDAPVEEPLVVVNDGRTSASFAANESAYWDEYAEHLRQLMAVSGS
ncbi:NAD-dependent epimerase/dehydratase family protein [Agromyces sp. NPDC057679]|uniref:NAD-dependent epimerase/dehydratase family protein n=1 Tax=Agromyces sp. NPDC057679 TaxID=3346207 RepID=UPI00366CF4D9